MQIDTSTWSGEGTFTQVLHRRLQTIDGDRVSCASRTRRPRRSEADYNFISNEMFVGFTTTVRQRARRALRRCFRPSRDVVEKAMTLAGLERALTALADIGAPDYCDEGMLQYLRAERIVPPYQTRGYKLVELVRIYEAGTPGGRKADTSI